MATMQCAHFFVRTLRWIAAALSDATGRFRKLRGHRDMKALLASLNSKSASVADVDKAVSAGPGIRWAVMGPTTLFHLGGGDGVRQHLHAIGEQGELVAPGELVKFQRWLERHDCYVFTINGFPFGRFHGGRVKEQVYAPDWTTPERLAYTNLLFDLLGEIVPAGVEGSVSTVPGSFKGFIAAEPARREAIFSRLTACGRAIADLAARTGRDLHLGLEPEPRCLFETSTETVEFFQEWRTRERGADELLRHVGVNYDCCHLGVEFESVE